MRRFGWVIVLWLLAMDAALAAGTSFGEPRRLTLAWHSSFHLAVGDVDGDARDDLVVSARNSPDWDYRLQFFLQNPDGTLAPAREVTLPESIYVEYRMALTDLDGDGRLEAVVGAPETTGLQVIRMSREGHLSVVAHEGPGGSCKYIVAGDVDRDGNADIVCHDEQLTASVYFGNGRGGFRSHYRFQTLAGWYILEYDFKSLQLSDVTGDGYADLLISAGHSQSFHVFANDRMGGFLPGIAYPHPRSPDGSLLPSVDIHVADIDGDGVNEVLTATPNERPHAMLNIFRTGAGGYLRLSERIPVHDHPTAILTGRVGDGIGVDVVLAHYAVGVASVLGENGGGLHSQSIYWLPGFGNHIDLGDARRQYAVALGDLDGDGCNDLAAATYSGVVLLHGCQQSVRSLPPADFDGDGVSDLLWYQPDMTTQYLFQWGRLELHYMCAGMYRGNCPRALGQRMEAQAIGDFDGDRNADVFWRDPASGENRLRLGAFDSRDITAVTNLDWVVVGAGDFDGDARADLLWRNSRSGANVVWRSADYRTQFAVQGVTDARWQVVGVGDFDGDGRSDILWRHAARGQNVIWRSARYQTQTAITAVTNPDWKVRGIGDFNGDGMDDIVWRNVRTGANTIWLSGNYRTQQAVVAVTNQDWQIAIVGDYNGDGLSDLVWRQGRTGANTIWLAANYRSQQELAAWPTDMQLVR